MLLGDRAKRPKEFVRRLAEAPVALDGLDDDRGHAVRRDLGREQLVERGEGVLVRDAVERVGEATW